MAAGEGVTAVAAAEGRKMIMLKSSDGKEHQMSVKAAKLSSTLLQLMQGVGTGNNVPLPNVDSIALNLVIRYCEKHAEVTPAPAGDNSDPSSGAAASGGDPVPAPAPAPTTTKDALEKWDKEFVDGLAQGPLFDLIRAAQYLHITGLLDLTCAKVAGMINGMTVEQIRETFNIVNDYTKEDEEEIHKEYAWAFDD